MPNEVKTIFTADSKDLFKTADLVENRLKTGKFSPSENTFAPLEKGMSASFLKVETSVKSLSDKVNDLSRPTFGGAYYEESRKINTSLKTIETTAENVFTKTKNLVNAGAESLKRMSNFSAPTFGKADNALYEDIEKTRLAVQKLNSQKLDAGKLDGLTQAGVRLHDQLGKAQTDISRINNALKQTNNKTFIDELNKDLVVAQNNFDKLQSKQQLYERRAANVAKNKESKIGKLQGYGDLINQVAPSGVNEGSINAAISAAELAGISTASVAMFGAIAAAGAVVVKVTQNIREEAERRLKVETAITGAINKQILSQKAALENSRNVLRQDDYDRKFNRFADDSSIEELKRLRANYEKVQSLTPTTLNGKPNESFEKNLQTMRELNARIDAAEQNNINKANQSFNQRFDNLKKSEEDARVFEEKRREEAKKALEKRTEDIKQATEKVEQLGKQYNSVFENLLARANKDNPIANVFLEGKKELDSLKESLRGLAPELQNQAIALQNKLNDNALFSAGFDNKLNAFDLRDSANNYRFPKTDSLVDKKRFDEIINIYLSRDETRAGNALLKKDDPNYRRDAFEYATLFNATKNQANPLDYVGFLAGERRREREGDNPNLSLQERLQKQIAIIESQSADTPEKRALADRKLIALTQGVNANQLTDRQRDYAAGAREREADRIDQHWQKQRELDQERNSLLKRVADSNETLIEVAKKGGSNALDITLKNQSDASADIKKQTRAATPKDTENYYQNGGSTYYSEYENK